jgi:hypothetical protein
MSKFSLKYLQKFICEHNIKAVCINGGPLPTREIMSNKMVELNLRAQGLYSEDLFLLSIVINQNKSLKIINLSKNHIGQTFVEERKILEIKMKNQHKIREGNFETLFYNSLGIEHFANTLSFSDRI